ncbi:MAG TPA: hypothetical protein VKR32_12225 [Puia sp.]|nr:hypothetical protein [Puia sp.]
MMSRKAWIQKVHIETIRDEVEPPPPQLNSRFNSLEAWLHYICNSDQPKIPILTYEFDIFFCQPRAEFVVVLVGFNTYGNYEKIDFEPLDGYYLVPKSESENLDYAQYNNLLTKKLQTFTKSKMFKESNLAIAETLNLCGRKIWSHE